MTRPSMLDLRNATIWNGDKVITSVEFFDRKKYHLVRDSGGYEILVNSVVWQEPDGPHRLTFISGIEEEQIWQNGRWVSPVDTTRVIRENVSPNLQRLQWRDLDMSGERQAVVRFCREWVRTVKDGGTRSVWLWGEPGRGKSQVASLMLQDLLLAKLDARYVDTQKMLSSMRAGYAKTPGGTPTKGAVVGHEMFEKLRDSCMDAKILFLDDVSRDRPAMALLDSRNRAEDERRLLTEIVERRLEQEMATVYIDNLAPTQLEMVGFDPRLVSRFQIPIPVSMPGRDFRVQLM